jgi:hypothetical protein
MTGQGLLRFRLVSPESVLALRVVSPGRGLLTMPCLRSEHLCLKSGQRGFGIPVGVSQCSGGTSVAGPRRVIAAIIIVGFVAAGLIIGLVATATAPLGYQDETGFHYGQPHGERAQERLPLEIPQPRLA